jgi:hypothetical protein
VPDTVISEVLAHELVAPGDDMGARHIAELFSSVQASEGHEIVDVLSVGPPGVGICEIGEPFDLGGDLRQGLKLGGGQTYRQGCRANRDR